MQFLKKLFGMGNHVPEELACTKGHMFPTKDTLFLCPEQNCDARSSPPRHVPAAVLEKWQGKPVFRAAKYDYSVICPKSTVHTAFIKICPKCGTQLPLATGQSATIAIVGASSSGKTCFTTALIRQINQQLAGEDAYNISLEWDDEPGKKYFREKEGIIFREGLLPSANQKKAEGEAMDTMQITIRFPLEGWWRKMRLGEQGAVSMVFHDPAGEYFETSDNLYFLHYLVAAQSVLLMVDPFASEEYQEILREEGKPVQLANALSAHGALDTFIKAIRSHSKQFSGKIPKHLAVVLTKCDETGMFDPDHRQHQGKYPVQGVPYDPALADEISQMVSKHMSAKLGMKDVVALAKNTFKDVCFFAVSALGKPPKMVMKMDEYSGEMKPTPEPMKGRVPRRVEEPLLWILHKWGFF